MDSKQLDTLKAELFDLVRVAVRQTGMPYASLLVDKASGVVIAKDYNTTVPTFDPTNQCSVGGLRKAQRALETDDLSHTYIFSFFEPTVLSFDIAMFAKITNFAWCINAADAPDHYVIKEYSPTVCAQQHPDIINIMPGYAREEALALLGSSTLRIPKGFRLGPSTKV